MHAVEGARLLALPGRSRVAHRLRQQTINLGDHSPAPARSPRPTRRRGIQELQRDRTAERRPERSDRSPSARAKLGDAAARRSSPGHAAPTRTPGRLQLLASRCLAPPPDSRATPCRDSASATRAASRTSRRNSSPRWFLPADRPRAQRVRAHRLSRYPPPTPSARTTATKRSRTPEEITGGRLDPPAHTCAPILPPLIANTALAEASGTRRASRPGSRSWLKITQSTQPDRRSPAAQAEPHAERNPDRRNDRPQTSERSRHPPFQRRRHAAEHQHATPASPPRRSARPRGYP
jgi:hypothetical protein